jgi:CheY-like chemotaxis protein
VQEEVPRRKLLLADDSITIQKVVNLTFADEGIDVVAVGDGNSALDKLREDSPDIVLADVNMPGLTGYELCAEVKGRDFADQVPVILLVGSFEPFDEEEAERVGADGYLTKPFQSINLLVSKVMELLGYDEDQSSQEFEDTAEIIEERVEFSSVTIESNVPEPMVPSFPDPLEGLINKQDTTGGGVDEPYTDSADSGDADFSDADEFEMSEAFADDEGIETYESTMEDDQQIEEVTEDFLKTQPFTESDLQEISVDNEVSDVPETDISFEKTYAGDEQTNDSYSQPDQPERIEIPVTEPTYEKAPVETTDVETGYSPPQEDSEAEEEDFDRTDDFENWEPENPESDLPQPEGASVLDLDEMNLLELPPVDIEEPELPDIEKEEEPVEEYQTKEAAIVSQIDEPYPVPNFEADERADLEDDKPEDSLGESGSDASEAITSQPEEPQTMAPESSSDEADLPSKDRVEAITRRVIETLSEKAIREIAWEVVPDLADLIIKKMAEEKMKD